jgi:hypothetical protein
MRSGRFILADKLVGRRPEVEEATIASGLAASIRASRSCFSASR